MPVPIIGLDDELCHFAERFAIVQLKARSQSNFCNLNKFSICPATFSLRVM
jgi:hypothetical protein